VRAPTLANALALGPAACARAADSACAVELPPVATAWDSALALRGGGGGAQ
jgi:hypothetical protein